MDDSSPTARALLCLAVLQERPGITADELGRRLGVSGRAARRYVAILREADIPVESATGPYGGYRIGRGTRPAPMLFTRDEAVGLVMAVLDGHHAAGDSTDPVGSALGKLLRSLPEPVARQAEAMRRTAAAVPDRGAARPSAETAGALVHACGESRRVRISYRTEAGSAWELEVDPWAVVVRHGRWYLLCWSHRAEERRAYRVDRVGAVVLLEQRFTPPTDLDAVADLEAHLAVGWEHATEVVVDGPLDVVGRCLPRTLGRLEALGPSTCRLLGSTSNPWWYAGQLAGQLAELSAAYRIVGGPELREAATVLARRMQAAVGEEPLSP
ncbi:YafY family protein [uncultured Nocardioides sp.]|uniref:Transcriptional regulator n=1 Tax=uncultured Nocardioides sp. TaxID=198441 RepID=A0A6J4PAK7_9ACTN|nr:WYL domain-containing protein [uncultured Nocardioides sp.]CAA9405551.1 MAG: Transcriptional regulator [uncultured Nocardioides sp.]